MLFGRYLGVEIGIGNSDRARKILVEDFGLVPPSDDPFNRTGQSLLVWEDDEGIGRYRVHFYDDCQKCEKHYEGIQFKYWMNDRMRREIFEIDPMAEAIAAVRVSLEGEFFERELGSDKTIDEVLL